jgi:hypothetical protein
VDRASEKRPSPGLHPVTSFADNARRVLGPLAEELGLRPVTDHIILGYQGVTWAGDTLFIDAVDEPREKEVHVRFGPTEAGRVPSPQTDKWFWVSELVALYGEPKLPIKAEGGDTSKPLLAAATAIRKHADELLIGGAGLYHRLSDARAEAEARNARQHPQ